MTALDINPLVNHPLCEKLKPFNLNLLGYKFILCLSARLEQDHYHPVLFCKGHIWGLSSSHLSFDEKLHSTCLTYYCMAILLSFPSNWRWIPFHTIIFGGFWVLRPKPHVGFWEWLHPIPQDGQEHTRAYSTNAFKNHIGLFVTASPWKLVFMLFIHYDSKTHFNHCFLGYHVPWFKFSRNTWFPGAQLYMQQS